MKIYVDGENFRHAVANVLIANGKITGSRDLEGFPLRGLLEDVLDVADLDIAYYSSKVKLPRGYEPSAKILQRASEIREYNRKWVANLISQKIEHIKAGYLKVKSGDACASCGEVSEILQEKGVDVRLAVDIITETHGKKKGTKIALMSSDSDLIPAVDRARKSGIYVIYLCFGEFVNRALSQAADETVTISSTKSIHYFEGK